LLEGHPTFEVQDFPYFWWQVGSLSNGIDVFDCGVKELTLPETSNEVEVSLFSTGCGSKNQSQGHDCGSDHRSTETPQTPAKMTDGGDNRKSEIQNERAVHARSSA
jgi:hypothetical protein